MSIFPFPPFLRENAHFTFHDHEDDDTNHEDGSVSQNTPTLLTKNQSDNNTLTLTFQK